MAKDKKIDLLLGRDEKRASLSKSSDNFVKVFRICHRCGHLHELEVGQTLSNCFRCEAHMSAATDAVFDDSDNETKTESNTQELSDQLNGSQMDEFSISDESIPRIVGLTVYW